MKVKAIRKGYYGKIRVREGQEFYLEKKEDFSKAWMEEVKFSSTSKAKKEKTKPETKEEDVI